MNWLKSVLHRLCFVCHPRQSRTVRFAFPLVAVVAAFLGASVIDTESSSYVRIVSSKTAVEANEEFSIDVYAYAAEPVNAVNISLSFSSEHVTIIGVDIGRSVITLWTQDPYIEGNKVILSGGTYQKGFKGEHLIATVNVRAKQTGLAQFSAGDIRLLAGDGLGTPVSLDADQSGKLNLFVTDQDTDINTIAAALGLEIVTDIDGDGNVTLRDVSVFMAAWATRSRIFDFDGDGRMTFRDFSIILSDSFFK